MLSNGQKEMSAMHGTPWPLDSHVPILLWGSDVPARGRVTERADPRNIAVTVAKKLAILPPSGATTGPLPGF